MPGAAAGVTHQASDLGLMHGIDHRRRCAVAAEHVADVHDVRRACALAAQVGRHGSAQQPFGARRIDRLFGESRLGIDCRGMGGGHYRDLFRACHQIRRSGDLQIAGGDENAAHGTARDATVFIDLLERHWTSGIHCCARDDVGPSRAIKPRQRLPTQGYLKISNSSCYSTGISAVLCRKGYQSQTHPVLTTLGAAACGHLRNGTAACAAFGEYSPCSTVPTLTRRNAWRSLCASSWPSDRSTGRSVPMTFSARAAYRRSIWSTSCSRSKSSSISKSPTATCRLRTSVRS